MEILEDGSVKGKTFSGDKYTGGYPHSVKGETFADYHEKVDKAVAKGFHKGDLSWGDWQYYCYGSGQFDGVDSNDRI